MVRKSQQNQTSSISKATLDEINAQYGKLPPQAIELEEAVLGALMLEAYAIHNVSDIIDTHSFYKNEHQVIFDTIKDISVSGKEIDLLTVTQTLRDNGKLEEVGGAAHITGLTRRVASAAHIEFHARIIAQKYIQRELIRVSTEIQIQSYDDTIDVDDLLNDARSKLDNVDNFLSLNTSETSQIVAKNALDELEKDYKATNEGESPGITTGLIDLNYALGGWRKTNFIVLAARPSVGKSSLALFFAVEAARAGIWVNFYGLEMKSHDYFRILLSAETTISRTDIRDGRLNESDWEKISTATAKLEKLPIIWSDNPSVTANHVRSATIRNKRAGKCGLVIIDYLQLMKPADKNMIREQQISDMSRTIKETALSEDVPMLALSQLNRNVESRSDKEPNLSDLRESGAIEQDADVVLFLWDQENPKLKIGKNRRGKIGPVDFWANEEKTKFADQPPSEAGFPTENSLDFSKSDDTPF